MADLTKLNKAFDVMALALGEAGLDIHTITKFLQNARRSFGIAHEDPAKTQIKAEMAVLAGELQAKETSDDSSVDGSGSAAQPGKTGRAGAKPGAN